MIGKGDRPGEVDPDARVGDMTVRELADVVGKVVPERIKPEWEKPEWYKPELRKPERVKPERVKPEEIKPESLKPETLKPERKPPEQLDVEDFASAFRIRDLMVTVLPERVLADCTNDTHCGGGCSNQHTDCPGGCSNARSDFHTTHCAHWMDPAELVQLQAVLDAALEAKQVEGARPHATLRSVEQIEKLEQHLTNALEQLRIEKEALSQG